AGGEQRRAAALLRRAGQYDARGQSQRLATQYRRDRQYEAQCGRDDAPPGALYRGDPWRRRRAADLWFDDRRVGRPPGGRQVVSTEETCPLRTTFRSHQRGCRNRWRRPKPPSAVRRPRMRRPAIWTSYAPPSMADSISRDKSIWTTPAAVSMPSRK